MKFIGYRSRPTPPTAIVTLPVIFLTQDAKLNLEFTNSAQKIYENYNEKYPRQTQQGIIQKHPLTYRSLSWIIFLEFERCLKMGKILQKDHNQVYIETEFLFSSAKISISNKWLEMISPIWYIFCGLGMAPYILGFVGVLRVFSVNQE